MTDEAKQEAQAAYATATSGPVAPVVGTVQQPPGQTPPPVPTLSKEEMGKAAIGFVEFWTPMFTSITGLAMGRDVPPATGMLTGDEKDALMLSAAAGYPLLEKMIMKSEAIGGIIFLGTYGAIVYRKVSLCPKVKPKVKVVNEPGAGAGESGDQTPVGNPFKATGSFAKKLGIPNGTYVQKLSDGNYITVEKPKK